MSNLLEKASILLTPTAYDDGKILSVKPAPSLGSELVTNGGFDTDSDWTKQTSWSISGGAANYDFLSDAKYIRQTLLSGGFVSGKTYRINFDITSGTAYMYVNSNAAGLISLNTYSVGSYSIQVTASASGSDLLIYGRNTSGTAFSIDNVSVKEVIDGDFDFTRNSSATRVNAQGLVEDVQILSSNLLQNGDFSQEGSEQITNGDFSNGSTDWSNPDNAATFSNDSVTISGGSGNRRIAQANVTSPTSAQWKLQYEITEKVGSSDLKVYTTNSGIAAYTVVPSTVGVHTFYFNSNLSTFYFNFSNITGSITIDNVSVKEVGQDWTFGTGWSIGDGKVYFENPTGTEFYQSLSTTASKYRISFDLDITSGTIQTSFNSPSTSTIQSFTTSGTKTVDITTTASFSRFRFIGLGGSVFNIDNVSVIEITDDTNLPRIDYTDGVGSWLFEPQSTNRMTTSEPTSGGAGFTFPAKTWANGLINGLNATEASSGTKYWYMSSGIANEYSTFSFFVEMEDGSEPIIGGNNEANSDFVIMVKGYFMKESDITKTNTISNVWKIEAPSRVNELANSSPIGILKYGTQSNKTFSATGFQIEQSSFATSYIPTNGSTVTRLQDAAFGAGSSDLINSTEGVLYWEGAKLHATSGTQVFGLSDGSATNRIGFQTSANVNQIRFVVDASGNQASKFFVLDDITDFNKLALKWKQDDFSFWVNGVKIGTDTSGNVPPLNTLNTLDFYYGTGIYNFTAKTKCVAVFKEALTDEELTCLTTI